MKQHISVKQLNELSDKGKEKYENWCRPRMPSKTNLLSIGQMLEFLEDNMKYQFSIFRRTVDWKVVYNKQHYGKILGGELADALWEACKDKLNVSN